MTALAQASTEESALRALSLAQLDSLFLLAQGLEGLKSASSISISIEVGDQPDQLSQTTSVERFWEAGAFHVLRQRIELLERVAADYERLADKLLGKPEAPNGDVSSVQAFHHLHLASHAFVAGDPEGALVHAVCSLRVSLELRGRVSLKALTAADHRLALTDGSRKSLMRAFNAAERFGRGEPDVAMSILLVRDTILAAHRVLFGNLPAPGLTPQQLADLIEAEQPNFRPIVEDRDA